jgi:hypothetical protein
MECKRQLLADCTDGEEWNFSFVLMQMEGEPIQIMIPISLQRDRWNHHPILYSTKTTQDVPIEYIEFLANLLQGHKFGKYVVGDLD